MEQTRRLSSEPTQLLPTKPWQTCEQYTLDYTEPVQHETVGLREEDTSKHRDMDNDLLNRTPGAWEMTLRPELTDGIAWMKILLHSKGKIHPEAGFFFLLFFKRLLLQSIECVSNSTVQIFVDAHGSHMWSCGWERLPLSPHLSPTLYLYTAQNLFLLKLEILGGGIRQYCGWL